MEPTKLKDLTDIESLAAEVVEVCDLRGWSLHWTERGAYLHLESSELIEAVRGKHGDPTKEAGDVLFVLLSLVQPKGITFASVIAALQEKITELKIKPRYVGEQFSKTRGRS